MTPKDVLDILGKPARQSEIELFRRSGDKWSDGFLGVIEGARFFTEFLKLGESGFEWHYATTRPGDERFTGLVRFRWTGDLWGDLLDDDDEEKMDSIVARNSGFPTNAEEIEEVFAVLHNYSAVASWRSPPPK